MPKLTVHLLGLATLASVASYGASKAVTAGGVLSLTNSHVRLELNAADFSLRQLTDLGSGVQYVKEPGGSLFLVKGLVPGERPVVWYVSAPGVDVSPQDFVGYEARTFSTPDGGAGWRLSFTGAPLGDGKISVQVSVSLPGDSPLLEWRIEVTNDSTTSLQDVIFPTLSGLASSREGSDVSDYIAAPLFSGVRYDHPRSETCAAQGQNEYPSSGASIQLLSYCDGQGGTLYFASHDGDNHRKTFVATPMPSKAAFSERIVHYPGLPAGPGTWRLPYAVMWGPVEGDWYDAAKVYRRWAITQPRWRTSLAERTDIPAWFPRLAVWFQGNAWSEEPEAIGELADRIVRMREKLGYDFGFHWYLWQKYIAHDYNYPDYLPARPGFDAAVATVQRVGVRVMPYINLNLCETQLPLWQEKRLADAAKINQAGELYFDYGICGDHALVNDTSKEQGPVDVFRGPDQKGRRMVPMCPAQVAWQDVIVNVADGLLKGSHVDCIYYDETFVFPGLCFARNHSHPWHGGNHHAEGIAQIHRRTHALRPEGVLTTGENLGESYTDCCAGLINAHSDMRPDSLPIFQTVHADRTTEIGVFTNRVELASPDVFASKLAFSLTRGRVLGWFNSDQGVLDSLVDDSMVVQLQTLQRYCAARLVGLPFLYSGEMLRAPDLSSLPKVTRRWEIWPTYEQKVDYDMPVALGAMFRSQDGSLGLVLCNHTAEQQTVSVPWNAKDWEVPTGRVVRRVDFADGVWGTPTGFTVPDALPFVLQPYAPLLVRLSEDISN